MDRFHRGCCRDRASSGEIIGFGARSLFDDDQNQAKYVNTPETVLYKKSSVLFGLDHANAISPRGTRPSSWRATPT